jgi:hypothetical protein
MGWQEQERETSSSSLAAIITQVRNRETILYYIFLIIHSDHCSRGHVQRLLRPLHQHYDEHFYDDQQQWM